MGESYGIVSYKLYEAWEEGKRQERPLLMMWLHGADDGDIAQRDLLAMLRHLGRKTYFLVPLNPKGGQNGLKFMWGVSFTKAQNKNQLGFIYGEIHEPLLQDMCSLVSSVSVEVSATHVCAAGYSMGAFGVYQFASYAPDVFDAAIAVAGYGLGTVEPANSHYCAPQPESSHIFGRFLDQIAPGLAKVPVVLAVHAETDNVSSFKDTSHIVAHIQDCGGKAHLHVVPSDQANSDCRRKNKNPMGHSYFTYSLLGETSEDAVWEHIRAGLESVPARPVKKWYAGSVAADLALQAAQSRGTSPDTARSRSPHSSRSLTSSAPESGVYRF